jgi:hypothetical protein
VGEGSDTEQFQEIGGEEIKISAEVIGAEEIREHTVLRDRC